MAYHERRWTVGYGTGLTGPTTPSAAPTVKDSVLREAYYQAYRLWSSNKMPGPPPSAPIPQYEVISCGMETIAIIPTCGELDGRANAQRIVDCVSLCQGLTTEQIQEAVTDYKERGLA